jgi:hypothetical protein
LAEAEADDGQDQDWEDLNVDDHHFCVLILCRFLRGFL